jgi:hypothetical protein
MGVSQTEAQRKLIMFSSIYRVHAITSGAGTRDTAVEAVRRLPDLPAVALAHVVDYLRSFQSEGVLQQVSASFACAVHRRVRVYAGLYQLTQRRWLPLQILLGPNRY